MGASLGSANVKGIRISIVNDKKCPNVVTHPLYKWP